MTGKCQVNKFLIICVSALGSLWWWVRNRNDLTERQIIIEDFILLLSGKIKIFISEDALQLVNGVLTSKGLDCAGGGLPDTT